MIPRTPSWSRKFVSVMIDFCARRVLGGKIIVSSPARKQPIPATNSQPGIGIVRWSAMTWASTATNAATMNASPRAPPPMRMPFQVTVNTRPQTAMNATSSVRTPKMHRHRHDDGESGTDARGDRKSDAGEHEATDRRGEQHTDNKHTPAHARSRVPTRHSARDDSTGAPKRDGSASLSRCAVGRAPRSEPGGGWRDFPRGCARCGRTPSGRTRPRSAPSHPPRSG